jgi:large subunit ribosomal protein L9
MANPIHVVLKEDVESLGTSGDVVRVRPGFARNYLIPRGLAVPATSGNLARVEDLKRLAATRAEKALTEARQVATKLEALSVKIARAVGEENRMYGSVTPRDIEEAFSEQGVSIDRKKIQLAEPLKALGLASVPIKLHPQVVAKLSVEVVKKS